MGLFSALFGSNTTVFNTKEIGGSPLDRFYVECVLAGYSDFTQEICVERAKTIAAKYRLNYSEGIEELYKKDEEAHKEITRVIKNNRIAELKRAEAEEAEKLNKYASLQGKGKRVKMLKDQADQLLEAANDADKYAYFVMRSTQEAERDWASWGGAAYAVGGVALAAGTIIDIEAQNAQIRERNAANRQAALPEYMKVTTDAAQMRKNAAAIQKEIEKTQERLYLDQGVGDLMEAIEITDTTLDISETGAFRITATVQPKKPVQILDKLPAYVDGTLIAHVMDNNTEIGKAYMVLPVDGASKKTGIVGMGLSGAEKGKSYTVKYTPYHLWIVESL